MSKTFATLVSVVALCLSLAAAAEESEPVAEATAPADDAVEMPVIEIVGTPDKARKLPGSAQVIDRETLGLSHVMTTGEALRKAAGVNVRDEEGFGLRPNIGIRGLNPTRSTKVLLLEDGIPLAYAPYGDNASYYHPPVDRFDRIEILKGAGQNIYGPQTIGGVINYITPAPPENFAGGGTLTGGNREYLNAHGFVGGRGMLFNYARKQGDAARDNTHTELNDVSFKGVARSGDQALTARMNYYTEDSQLTYSGLTDAEYANFGPDYNAFRNDFFEADRQGMSLTYEAPLGAAILTTNVYGSRFNRDWWRQSSTTTFNPVPSTDPRFASCQQIVTDRTAGQQVNPDSCDANIGNLREYYSYGVEPRLRVAHDLFGTGGEFETGVRAHFEEQDRVQKIGSASTAREGSVAESNERLNQAYSAFVQNRFAHGAIAVIPALRVEHVRYERTNRLTGVTGETEITEWVPSLGATLTAGESSTLFAGAHRGFAPPTTADLINDATGGTRDLDAEKSWNYELGARTRPAPGVSIEGTAFLNDFQRQIAVGSIAGGSTPLATGQTRYEGVELLARTDLGRILDSTHNPFLEVAYTWLPTADQETPFLRVDNGMPIAGSVAGNRLPYAPENLLTAGVGYNHVAGFDTRFEAVYVGSQFADFANTASAAPNGNGHSGEIASFTVWNAAVSYRLPATGVGVFLTAKNLFDKVYIVDRTRGILPGAPRLVQAGVEYTF